MTTPKTNPTYPTGPLPANGSDDQSALLQNILESSTRLVGPIPLTPGTAVGTVRPDF